MPRNTFAKGNPGPRKTRPDKTPQRWDDRFYVQAYLLAKGGSEDSVIATQLGASITGFQKWVRAKPALAAALRLARSKESGMGSYATFQEFVYGRLDPHLQSLWDQLEACDELDNAVERIERLFKDKGHKARQHMFIHALVMCNFSRTEACRRVNIPYKTVQKWLDSEVDFADLVHGIAEAKKDFFESALIAGIARGDPNLIQFANRTANKDRGYAEGTQHKLDVNVKGEVQHKHLVDISKLELPQEVREIIADALEAYEEQVATRRLEQINRKPRLLETTAKVVEEEQSHGFSQEDQQN
jgi:hypothetical protein